MRRETDLAPHTVVLRAPLEQRDAARLLDATEWCESIDVDLYRTSLQDRQLVQEPNKIASVDELPIERVDLASLLRAAEQRVAGFAASLPDGIEPFDDSVEPRQLREWQQRFGEWVRAQWEARADRLLLLDAAGGLGKTVAA